MSCPCQDWLEPGCHDGPEPHMGRPCRARLIRETGGLVAHVAVDRSAEGLGPKGLCGVRLSYPVICELPPRPGIDSPRLRMCRRCEMLKERK